MLFRSGVDGQLSTREIYSYISGPTKVVTSVVSGGYIRIAGTSTNGSSVRHNWDDSTILAILDLTEHNEIYNLSCGNNTNLYALEISHDNAFDTLSASSCNINNSYYIDEILSRLDLSGVNGSVVLLGGGTNIAPSSSGLVSKASLESSGWAVTVNNVISGDAVTGIYPPYETYSNTTHTGLSFQILAVGAWTITSIPSWLSLSVTSGSGNTVVTYSISANGGVSRTNDIVVTSNTNPSSSLFFRLTQSIIPNGDVISLSPTSTSETSAPHTNLTFNVGATGDWSVTTNSSWVTLSTTSGSGNGTVTFGTTINKDAERYGTITVTSDVGGDSMVFNITQLELVANSNISISKTSYAAISGGQTISLNLTSNSEWDSTSSSWLNPSPSYGDGSRSVSIYIDNNPYDQVRLGSIMFRTLDDEASAIIDVSQSACLSPDTPITMGDGSFKPLSDIVLGDIVRSFTVAGLKDDESNVHTWNASTMSGEPTTSEVIKLVNGSYKEYYIINGIMKITFEHHVLIFRDRIYKFIPIRYVNIGDCLWSDELGNIEIETKEYIQEEHPFITMDVEVTDVYFAHGMLVHNPAQKIETEGPPVGGPE